MIGLPVFFLIVLAVLLLMAITTGRAQRFSGRQRLCGSCGAAHPPFAQYCRRCGKKL
ncbi:MAG TPA: hypothetical protein VH370_24460 [Humisphaera sp.]|nr:hypothetical protein [Humisphaera sp.]